MSDYPEVPPWEPIADWLARLPQEPQEDSKQNERFGTDATQQAIRERYELEAKAIAYDIATTSRGKEAEPERGEPYTPYIDGGREAMRQALEEWKAGEDI